MHGARRDVPFAPAHSTVGVLHLNYDRLEFCERAAAAHTGPISGQTDLPQRISRSFIGPLVPTSSDDRLVPLDLRAVHDAPHIWIKGLAPM